MKRYSTLIFVVLIAGWFAGNVEAESGLQPVTLASEEFCRCVNEPIDTDEKARACGALMDAMTPEERTHATGECNGQQAAASGVDVCFCLKTFLTDPEVIKACEAVIGKDTKPSEMSRLAADCR